jgi:two-component system, OmpR family, response regulator
MRLLVVEDDRRTAEYVTRGMMEAGHRCDLLADGRDALTAATFDSYDVIVADRMIPELDGLSLVKAIRAAGVMTPVIFLTALGGIDDRVEGLESGGDDYLIKPFAFSELLARVNALGRRPAQVEQKTALRVADLDMDLVRHRVSRQGRVIELQPREFSLLEVLMRAEGRVVTRTMLLERVWDFHFDPKTTVVETHISRLRGKIDKPFETPLLHTIRNSGYSLYAEA